MKKKKILTGLLLLLLLLSGCGSKPLPDEAQNIYQIPVIPTAEERESEEVELTNAFKATAFYTELAENADVFICDTWNYGIIEGKPRYEHNEYPLASVEVDSYGHSIRVSKNYFRHNPIETSDGSDLISNFVDADNTLNVLVPEQYRLREQEISDAYLDRFYFDKIEVENIYNERQGRPLNSTGKDGLNIHIIYVKDGQSYFTFNKEIAVKTGYRITDPVVMIYTANIHPIQTYSMMSRAFFLYSEAQDAVEAYEEIGPYAEKNDIADIFKEVRVLEE
jgi:putative ABC transport system permease protein